MRKTLSDIHTYLLISLTTITALLFNIFGDLGLVIYGLLIIYGLVFFFFNSKSKTLLNKPPFYFMLAYYMYFLLATCINGSLPQRGSAIAQLFLLSLMAFFIRANSEVGNDTIAMSKVMTTASIIMGVTSILISIFTYKNPGIVMSFPLYIKNIFLSVTGDFPTRMRGFTNHPNITAEFCLVGTMFSIFLIAANQSRFWNLLGSLNIATSVFTIFIATNSRTSMVCFLAFSFTFYGLFAFIINKSNEKIKRRRRYILLFLLLFFLLLLTIYFLSNQFRTFVNEHILRISSLSTASGRDSVYKIAFELGKGHRLFGYNEKILSEQIAPHAHNMYLQLISFAGIPGFLLYFIFLISTFCCAVKNFICKEFNDKEKILNCFFLSYILCYIFYGLPEDAGINRIKTISVYSQVIFAFINILYYNNVNVRSFNQNQRPAAINILKGRNMNNENKTNTVNKV